MKINIAYYVTLYNFIAYTEYVYLINLLNFKTMELNTQIIITTNSNNPNINFFTIVGITDKAIKVENEYGKSGWLPKKSLQICEPITKVYTFAYWFRQNTEAINNAFKLFN